MEYLPVIHNASSHFSAHLTVTLCHKAYLQFKHINVVLLSCKQGLKGILALVSLHYRLWLALVVGCDKGGLFFLLSRFSILVFHCVKQVHYLFGCFLDDANQVGLFEPSIDDNSGYSLPELFVFLASFSKVGNIRPQLPPIFEINQKFSNIRVRAFDSITFDFTRSIGLQLYVDRSIATFSERNCFRIYNQAGHTWEKDIKAVSDGILSNEDVEDIEGDLIEKIVNYLKNERSAVVVRR